jgi:DNA-binding beta-propeller fold protein YncE
MRRRSAWGTRDVNKPDEDRFTWPLDSDDGDDPVTCSRRRGTGHDLFESRGVILRAMMSFVLHLLFAASINLPGGPPVGMDYLAYDPSNGRVWVPAGNTGNVDVIDTATGKVTPLGGFPTLPATRPGRPNMGPSSATVGDGVVWVGNRGDNKLCSFDARRLNKRTCVQLPSMPDGLAYVAATHEIWATTPRDHTITIVDVKDGHTAAPGAIKLEGAPEGFAVDGARGVFYTNLEDKDRTLAIDIKTRKVVTNWPSGCGGDGPRGLAIDAARRLLFVACTDGARALDLAQAGKIVGRLKTGAGVDNIDFHAKKGLLYVASGKDAVLTIAHVSDRGELAPVASVPTAKGARNPIVDADGTAYVSDGLGGRLIVVKSPAP